MPFPPPGELPDPGIKPTYPVFPALQADSLPLSYCGSQKLEAKQPKCPQTKINTVCIYIYIFIYVSIQWDIHASVQWCLTLCDPMDCSPPGSSVHGTVPARIVEWVAISPCRGFSQPRDQTGISCTSSIEGSSLLLNHSGSHTVEHYSAIKRNDCIDICYNLEEP